MKFLYLLRHAKSSWKHSQLDDFERPLNKRGRRDAPFMGEILKKREVCPDLVLSSPATRAAVTAREISLKIEYPVEKIVYLEPIYAAGINTLINIIEEIDGDVHRAMLCGHNPGLTGLANFIGDKPVANIPTCGIYGIEMDIASWHKIGEKCGKTIFFEFPKKH
jgi:phosphohistidine phosphatase